MPGTKQGGIKASKTNKKIHGADFYKRIGAIGGSKTKGTLYKDPERASEMGKIGGAKSKRTWSDEQKKEHGNIMKKYWSTK